MFFKLNVCQPLILVLPAGFICGLASLAQLFEHVGGMVGNKTV